MLAVKWHWNGPGQWLLGSLLLLGGCSGWGTSVDPATAAANERVAQVERADLDVSIASTGRLSARSTVVVGSQVSGSLASVRVDFNDRVSKGQVVAQIDPARYQAQLRSAQAAVARAEVAVQRAADNKAKLATDLDRFQVLFQRQLVARHELDERLDALNQAHSQWLDAGHALRSQREAVIAARYDLEQTTIRSPVDGVVLERLVEPGQTVVASFETPALFRIAEDLGQMTLALSVDEADIGQIQVGHPVQFSVEAFAGRFFQGQVMQKRLAPEIKGGSAVYPVMVAVDNQDLSLIPGMLADAQIQVAQRDDVLALPRQAVRLAPSSDTVPAGELLPVLMEWPHYQRLAAAQQQALRTAVQQPLQAVPSTAPVPADVAAFFGPAMAGRIVIAGADDADAASTRLRQLTAHFADFRALLDTASAQQWDAWVAALASSRRGWVQPASGIDAAEQPVLVGLVTDTQVEILSGLDDQATVRLPGSPSP